MATFNEIETRDKDLPWNGLGLPPGVQKAVVAFLGLVCVAAVPYLLPDDACVHVFGEDLCAPALRVWTQDDDIPFTNLFRTDGTGPAVAEASGGNVVTNSTASGSIALPAVSQALAAGDDDDGVGGPAIVVTAAPEPAPAPTVAPGASGDATPTAPSPAPEPAPASRIVIPPTLYADAPATIEDPSGALAPFYQALVRTTLKEPGAITRVTHWGDSGIAADGMTSAARRLLQRQFGDAGHGFILAESGSRWYKHKDVVWDRGGWKALKIIDNAARDGRYGYGGVTAQGYLGARATYATAKKGPVGTAASRFELHYLKAWKHGQVAVWVDDEEPVIVDTSAEDKEDGVHVLEVPDGPHRFTVRVKGGGPVRVYGAVLERAGPGVVYDSIGLVGARASRLLNADGEHWRQQLANRRPDLMIINYGGNELTDRRMSMTVYREKFRAVVRRFREGRPAAACLVMSPMDHGERHRGRVRSDPLLLRMMPVQREVALAEGCAWYSLFDAMGGDGAMGRWFKARPRLGWGDLAHATPAGARVLGGLFFKALMKGYADYLAQQRE